MKSQGVRSSTCRPEIKKFQPDYAGFIKVAVLVMKALEFGRFFLLEKAAIVIKGDSANLYSFISRYIENSSQSVHLRLSTLLDLVDFGPDGQDSMAARHSTSTR